MRSSDLRHRVGARDDRDSNPKLPSVLERLTDRRRAVLARLLEADRVLRRRTLAARLVAADGPSDPLEAVDDGAVDAVAVELEHRHLPALEAVGLVAREGPDGAVATTDHPLYADADFRRFLRADAALDGVVDCLTDAVRRRVLDVLDDRDGWVDREGLAAAVAAGSPTSADELRAVLHHVHLPKLDAHGFLEYDVDDGVVAPSTPASTTSGSRSSPAGNVTSPAGCVQRRVRLPRPPGVARE